MQKVLLKCSSIVMGRHGREEAKPLLETWNEESRLNSTTNTPFQRRVETRGAVHGPSVSLPQLERTARQPLDHPLDRSLDHPLNHALGANAPPPPHVKLELTSKTACPIRSFPARHHHHHHISPLFLLPPTAGAPTTQDATTTTGTRALACLPSQPRLCLSFSPSFHLSPRDQLYLSSHHHHCHIRSPCWFLSPSVKSTPASPSC